MGRPRTRRQRRDDEVTELVLARGDHLFRSALLLTGSPGAAEDLVQSTWARVLVAWPKVRAAEDPVAYAHRILINTFLSDRRRRSSTEVPVERIPERAADDRTDDADRLTVLDALALLSPRDRAVVVLRYWQDRSIEQTAHELGLTEAAVKNRSMRALRALRDHLTELTDTTTSGDPT